MTLTAIAVLAVGLLAQAQPHEDHKKHGSPDHMNHRFENPDQYAKSFDDPERDKWQMPDKVIATLGLKPGNAVADIGAGTGYFTLRLAQSSTHPKVFAADIEPNMLEHIRKRAVAAKLTNITTVKAGADSPNLPEAVDVILIVNTYHHIPNRKAYFAKLASSLKPGGRLAIVDWKPKAPMGPPEQFRFTPEKMSEELSAAGYKKAAQHEFLPNQNFLVFQRQ